MTENNPRLHPCRKKKNQDFSFHAKKKEIEINSALPAVTVNALLLLRCVRIAVLDFLLFFFFSIALEYAMQLIKGEELERR